MAAETVNVVLAVANITADPAPAVSMVSYFCDTTGGGFDVTVPNVADVTDGIQIRVTLSVGVSTVVVTTVGGTDLIGTATSQAITQAGTGITIQANAGSGKWEIVQDSRGMGQNRGNTLYVDAVFGNDGTALPDRADLPYLTPEAAKVAASTGDLIEVRSGDYVVTTNLAKDGVNWHLMEGANITFNASDGVSLFGDQGSAVVFSIGGLGSIRVELPTGSFTSHGFDTSNAGSSITAELLDLVISADSFNNDFCDLVHQEGGRIAIKCRDFLVTGAARSYGIWWTDGPMSLRARNMISDTTSGVAFCSFVSVNHPAGEAYVFADIIDSTNNMGDCIVQGVQEEATPTADSTAKVWITAGQIKGTDQDLISAIGKGNGGNLYVTTQKVTGYVVDYGEHGTFYLDTMKHQPIAGIGADQLHLEGFKSFINIGEVLDANIGGTYGTVSAGTHTLTINDCTRAFNGNGIDVSGGTLRLNDSRIDTSVDSTSSPISKTGGVLELKGTELVAEATADSIASDAPQDVTSRGSTVNTAVGSDITNLGDLFYDQGGPADDQVPTANADGTWSWADPGGGAGDVTGPASAVADNIALFDGTTGKTIKDAGINLSEIVEEDPGAGVGMIESGAGVSPIILKNVKDGQGTQVVNNTGSVQTDIHFSAIDKYFYSDVSGNPLEGTITTAGRNLIDDATVADQRTTLGLNPTAKGDIISASAASTPATLPVGLENQVLRSRAAAASGLEWGNAELRILIQPQSNTLTNQPNTPELLTPPVPGIYITRQDLTGYRQAKILVHVFTASGSGNNPRVILRYATTYTLAAGSFLDIGTTEVSASFSSVGVIQSSWIDLAAGALGDVYFAAVTHGGNGAADPTIALTTAIFR